MKFNEYLKVGRYIETLIYTFGGKRHRKGTTINSFLKFMYVHVLSPSYLRITASTVIYLHSYILGRYISIVQLVQQYLKLVISPHFLNNGNDKRWILMTGHDR